MSPYEYIHYESSDGRVFMKFSHESGFGTYSTDIELTPEEIGKLKDCASDFIDAMRSQFSHETKRFNFQKNRHINDFGDWPVVKEAINKWHGR